MRLSWLMLQKYWKDVFVISLICVINSPISLWECKYEEGDLLKFFLLLLVHLRNL